MNNFSTTHSVKTGYQSQCRVRGPIQVDKGFWQKLWGMLKW